MARKLSTLAAIGLTLPFAWACATPGEEGATANASTEASAGAAADTGGDTATGSTGTATGTDTGTGTTGSSGGSGGGALGSIPSLVNVNLQNVLNDLAVRLNLDRANIPVNAQIPISVAANVCGVSINILSVSSGGQANCTAKTASPELAQVVQQQIAAGGSVGGGAQGGSTAATSGSTTTGGTGTSGSTGTSTTSTGATETTPPDDDPQ